MLCLQTGSPPHLKQVGWWNWLNFGTDKLRSMEDCDPHKTDNSSFLIKRIFDEILTETRIIWNTSKAITFNSSLLCSPKSHICFFFFLQFSDCQAGIKYVWTSSILLLWWTNFGREILILIFDEHIFVSYWFHLQMRKVRLTFLISPFLWIWQIWCLQSSEFVGILPRYLCIFLTAAWLPNLGRCLNLMILMDRDGSRNLLGKKMRYCIYIVLYFFYLQSDIYNLTSHHTINIKFQFYWLLGLMPYLEARTLLHRMSTRLSTYCGRIHFVQNHHRYKARI